MFKGMDVVRKIESQKTNGRDQPTKEVKISKSWSEDANLTIDITKQI